MRPETSNNRLHLHRSFAVFGMLIASACSSSDPVTPASGVTRLEIAPGAVMLTAEGETKQLEVRAFNAAGEVVATPEDTRFEIPDDDKSSVVVASAGALTASAKVGSTKVVAKHAGIISAPILVLNARPKAGALLLTDAQITRVVAVDEQAEFKPGFLIRVELAAAAQATVGQVVLAVENQPVAGIVSAIEVSALILEVHPIAMLFDDFIVDERFALSTELAIGRRASPLTGQNASALMLGPFECEGSALAGNTLTQDATLSVDPDISFHFHHDIMGNTSGFQVDGKLDLEIAIALSLGVTAEAEFACEVLSPAYPIPFGGPLALIFGPKLKAGLGFGVSVKAGGLSIALEAGAKVKATTAIGYNCAAGNCEQINEFALVEKTPSLEPNFPDVEDLLQVELKMEIYEFVELAFGSTVLPYLDVDALKASLGVTQSLNLDSAKDQAEATDYRSEFGAVGFFSLGIGTGALAFFDWFQLANVSAEYRAETPIADSPTGVMTITPNVVKAGTLSTPGEKAMVTITLTDVTYLGFDSIDEVEVFWRKNDGMESFTLEPDISGCTAMDALPLQTVWTCEMDFLPEHVGEQTFSAFIHASLFGVPLPVPLEISDNSAATITITESNEPIVTLLPLVDGLSVHAESKPFDVSEVDERTGAIDPMLETDEIRAVRDVLYHPNARALASWGRSTFVPVYTARAVAYASAGMLHIQRPSVQAIADAGFRLQVSSTGPIPYTLSLGYIGYPGFGTNWMPDCFLQSTIPGVVEGQLSNHLVATNEPNYQSFTGVMPAGTSEFSVRCHAVSGDGSPMGTATIFSGGIEATIIFN